MTKDAWLAVIILALIAAFTISYVTYRLTGADRVRYRCDRCAVDEDDDDEDGPL